MPSCADAIPSTAPPSRHNREPLKFYDETIDFAAHYNIAPAQTLPVYCIDAEHGRWLTLMHWGLVPAWSKDAALGTNNARAETVAQKPAFRADDCGKCADSPSTTACR
jgi:putative SOS response-associated peptidase YedK